jgi:hypothetical protein
VTAQKLYEQYERGAFGKDVEISNGFIFNTRSLDLNGLIPFRQIRGGNARSRKLEDIFTLELADGVRKIARSYVGISLDTLTRELARYSGYSEDEPLSDGDKSAVEAAVRLLEFDNVIEQTDGFIYAA